MTAFAALGMTGVCDGASAMARFHSSLISLSRPSFSVIFERAIFPPQVLHVVYFFSSFGTGDTHRHAPQTWHVFCEALTPSKHIGQRLIPRRLSFCFSCACSMRQCDFSFRAVQAFPSSVPVADIRDTVCRSRQPHFHSAYSRIG